MAYSLKTSTALERLGIPPSLVARRGLREFTEAASLELAETGADGRQYLLSPPAATAWRELRLAATGSGIDIHIVSAFRSVDRQVELVQRKLAAGQALEEILAIVAPPGFSEHHTGRAVDIGTPGCPLLDTCFEGTAAFDWLRRRAGDFGFLLSYPRDNTSGYQYEPWHWCFDGGR